MTETFMELTEDEFSDRYPLVPNHINPSAGWAIGDTGGCLFETFGEEFDFIRRQDPRRVWMLIDGDGGDMYVISGLHHVNRIGYLLSTLPVPEDVCIQVHLPTSHQDDEQDARL